MTEESIVEALNGLRNDVLEVRKHVTDEVHRLELQIEKGLNKFSGDVGVLKYLVEGVQSDHIHLQATVKANQDAIQRNREEFKDDLNSGLASVRNDLNQRLTPLEFDRKERKGETIGASTTREKIAWVITAMISLAAIAGWVQATFGA